MPATVNYFIELTPSAQVMADKLRNVATYKIPLAIKRGYDTSMPDVVDNIKENRLSGKGPFPPSEHRLGEVTGLLKSSVSPMETTMDVDETGCTITGGIQVTGVPYANIHEFGFTGDENVGAHSRGSKNVIRVLRRQKQRKTEKQILTGGLPHPQTVRAYTRHMNMPARAPFRTGMLENLVRIKQAIQTELGRAVGNI